MTKLVIKWALLAPVSLFMAVFARLLCPILPLLRMKKGTCLRGCGGFRLLLTRLTGTMAHGNDIPALARCKRIGDGFVGSGVIPPTVST